MDFYSFSSLTIAWVTFAVGDGLALAGLIVAAKHDRRHVAAALYAVAFSLTGVYPVIWARLTPDPLWERLVGTGLWGALIGGTVCGIVLWILADADDS